MKRLLSSIILLFPLSVSAQNFIFNPGFDMSPWDTGWVKYTSWDTSFSQYAGAGVETTVTVSNDASSPPNCCYLLAGAGAGGGSGQTGVPSEASAMSNVSITQTFSPISNCLFKVSIKHDYYFVCGPKWGTFYSKVMLCINGNWNTFQTIDWAQITAWTEISTSIISPSTISGVSFVSYATASGGSMGCGWSSVIEDKLWIDDIQITELPVEESGSEATSRYGGIHLSISQNPFRNSTIIHYQLPNNVGQGFSLAIFDLSGKLVSVIGVPQCHNPCQSVTFNAKDLSSGIYFVTLSAGNQKITKKLILMK